MKLKLHFKHSLPKISKDFNDENKKIDNMYYFICDKYLTNVSIFTKLWKLQLLLVY